MGTQFRYRFLSPLCERHEWRIKTGIAATAVYPGRIDDHNSVVISLASTIPEARRRPLRT